jgi:hypothetical protein
MKNVKITHSVDYKGTALAKGVEIELDDATADRLIANGHAEELAEKAAKKKGDKE